MSGNIVERTHPLPLNPSALNTYTVSHKGRWRKRIEAALTGIALGTTLFGTVQPLKEIIKSPVIGNEFVIRTNIAPTDITAVELTAANRQERPVINQQLPGTERLIIIEGNQ